MSWSHAPIGDVVRITRSGVAPDEIVSGTTYIGLEHIDSSGEFVATKAVEAGELGSSKFRFTTRHVLFGKLRPYLKKTARPNFEGVCSTDILPLEPTKYIDRDYLFHVLRRQRFIDEVSSLCAGANLPRISPKVLASMQIPVPPLAEQRRIASILDKADALRAKRREAIAKLDQLLQSVFIDMFGDPVTNPKGWDKVRMGELMSISRGGSPRPIEKFLGGEHHWVKIGDATKGDDVYISNTKEKIISQGLNKTTHLRAGSLIFANCGVSLGFARILSIDGCIHDGWLAFQKIDPLRLNQLFLLKVLNSITAHFRAMAPEGTQPNLNTGIMKAFELIVPPLLLQQRFAEIVESVRARKFVLLKAETSVNHLFSSVQNAAFNGHL